MKKIVIDPVTRIEGHAKITIQLDDDDRVAEHGVPRHPGARLREVHRGPALLRDAVHHRPDLRHLPDQPPAGLVQGLRRHHERRASPPTAAKLRELLHCGQFVQSHALSFFHLSAPDLLLGFDVRPARRNVLGVLEDHPDIARDGIALRKFGQQVIEGLARERIHPSWIVPGGVNAPLEPGGARPHPGRPARRQGHRCPHTGFLQRRRGQFRRARSPFSATRPRITRDWSTQPERLQLYDGAFRFIGRRGQGRGRRPCRPRITPATSARRPCPHSYLKAPYFKPLGYPEGIYRVGPLARLNVATHCGTPRADAEFTEYHQRFGQVVQSSFHFHYARLIEIVYALERMEALLDDPEILDTPCARQRRA